MPYNLTKQPAGVMAEVEAITIEDLFALSCNAWRDAALPNKDESSKDSRFLYFQASSAKNLLSQLLKELNRMLFNHIWIFNSVEELKIVISDNEYKIYIDLFGNEFNPDLHNVGDEIKSIVLSEFNIENNSDNYFTKILFEI